VFTRVGFWEKSKVIIKCSFSLTSFHSYDHFMNVMVIKESEQKATKTINRRSISTTYFDDHLFFLTPLRPKRTGLLSVVFVSPMGLADHGPSIKVNNRYGEKASPEDWFIITIEDDPQVIGESAGLLACDVQKARKWVQVNKNELLKIWEDDVDVFDADLQQV